MESIMFRIINSEEWDRLCEENRRLEDFTERESRKKLTDGIMEAITDYDVHVREYTWRETARKILARGITCEPVEREPVVQQWDEQIDSLVSKDTKAAARNYSNQFRWHLFSFELLPALSGKEAQEAFDAIEKDNLYLFFDYAPEVYLIQNADLLNAEDLNELRKDSPLDYSDVYLFDPVGKWTYVRPHEEYRGPYFFKAK